MVDVNEDDQEVYAYLRQNSDTTLLVILNYTDQGLTRHYDVPSDAKLLISNYADDAGDVLRPYEAKVYQY